MHKLAFVAASLTLLAAAAPTPKLATAILAGGCFWSAEHDLERVPGVVDVVSGYTGGNVPDPSYEDVSSQTTGHYEAVRVTYDPVRISYAKLLDAYWHTINPTDAGGAFCDRGPEYRSAIFVTPDQRPVAESSKARLAASGVLKGPITTRILPASSFYPAEADHQDYARKHPVQYGAYRIGCGRDAGLKAVWRAH